MLHKAISLYNMYIFIFNKFTKMHKYNIFWNNVMEIGLLTYWNKIMQNIINILIKITKNLSSYS